MMIFGAECKKATLIISFFVCAATLSGCSMFGQSNVEIAPYKSIIKDDAFELREYEELVLVTTPMDGMGDQNSPFYRLFDYISGENNKNLEIPMTAPVFMEQSEQTTLSMSFVMPADYSIEETPAPKHADVKLEDIKNLQVATITFSGPLTQQTINEHTRKLKKWIQEKGYIKAGEARAAGYNPPFTIPALRRNEILIPVKDDG